jgi:hypothetical protein
VTLIRTGLSEEPITPVIRVQKISELRTTLVITSNSGLTSSSDICACDSYGWIRCEFQIWHKENYCILCFKKRLITDAVSAGFVGCAFYGLLTPAVFTGLLFMRAGVITHAVKDSEDIRFSGDLWFQTGLTCI